MPTIVQTMPCVVHAQLVATLPHSQSREMCAAEHQPDPRGDLHNGMNGSVPSEPTGQAPGQVPEPEAARKCLGLRQTEEADSQEPVSGDLSRCL